MQRILSRLPVLLLLAALVGGCASAQPFQGMDVEQVMEAGLDAYEAEDWDLAIDAFERVLFSSPGYERAPEARYNLARAFVQKEEYVTAASEFTRFLDRYPTHDLAPEVALGACRAYVELSPIVQRDQSYTREALSACRNVSQDYGDTEQGRRAAELAAEMQAKLARKILIGGQFYLERDMYDSAIIYFEDVIESYPESEAVPPALKGLVEANTAIGYEEEAEEWRQRLLEDHPDSRAARELRASRVNGAGG